MYLLSRCDTLHDFGGNGSGKSKRSLLSVAETVNLLKSHKTLNDNILSNAGKIASVNTNDLKGILNKSSAALVSSSFPKNLSPNILKRLSNITAFEPRTVLFYELLENELGNVNIGKYISSESLPGHRFGSSQDSGEYEYTDGTHASDEDFRRATISYLNLGVPAKDESSTSTPRPATGIFASTSDVDTRKNMVYEQLVSFYGLPSGHLIYFVVDTSSIALNQLGISNPSNLANPEKIAIICNIASDWDSAEKLACKQDNLIDTKHMEDNSNDLLQRSIFSFGNIVLNKKEAELQQNRNNNTNIISQSIASAIVEVNPLSACILNKKLCYKGALTNGEIFDIKRSGYAYQALITKNLDSVRNNNKFIFVTLDHLAFLKARLNGIPSIFTNIDQKTRERVMFLYKPDIDVQGLQTEYMRVKAKATTIRNNVLQLDNNTLQNIIASKFPGERVSNSVQSVRDFLLTKQENDLDAVDTFLSGANTILPLSSLFDANLRNTLQINLAMLRDVCARAVGLVGQYLAGTPFEHKAKRAFPLLVRNLSLIHI